MQKESLRKRRRRTRLTTDRVVSRPVGSDNARRDNADLVPLLQNRCQASHFERVDDRVGVEKQDERRTCLSPAKVAPVREAEVVSRLNCEQREVANRLEATVGRGIVDDDDVNPRFAGEPLDTRPELISAVVRDHHDVDIDHDLEPTDEMGRRSRPDPADKWMDERGTQHRLRRGETRASAARLSTRAGYRRGAGVPELALIDDALRHRLLDDLYEPGAFRHHQRLTNRVTQVVGVFPHTAPTVHPSGGVATGSRVAFVHRMPASMWSLPSVIALAVAIGFAAGYIGYRTQITAPTPSETGAPPPTVEAASRTTPKAASPGKIAAPLVPQRAATSAEGAGRTFAWVAATGVHAYEVQFFRGDKRVLSRRVKAPRLVLPRRWTYAGRNEALRPGSYRWYVWSIRGEPPRRAKKPVVQASFEIVQPG